MRLRIAVVGASPCERCTAACCRQNGHEYAVLLREEEYARFGPWSVPIVVQAGDRRVAERVLPYVNGRCRFLGEDNRCLIYEDRPRSCREFECTKAFDLRGHGEFLRRNPAVLRMLQSW